jgi:hypothetical protein
MVGRENDLDDVARSLYEFARDQGAPVIGALLLTCADESELECKEAMRNSFTEHVLPNLKAGERSSFRLANLGARYEWGSAAVVDEHFSLAVENNTRKLLVFKLNSHVCVDRTHEGLRFGRMLRYDHQSTFCGALHHLLDDGHLPFTGQLRESFGSEGLDRLDALRDPERVPATENSLFVAVVNARLQARKAMVDLQARAPRTPTSYLILPCVTLNRQLKDTEIVCGMYRVDWTGDEIRADYSGLGDDPTRYRLKSDTGRLRIEDDGWSETRPVRNHRELVLEEWMRKQGIDAGSETEVVIPSLAGRTGSDAETEAHDPRESLKRCVTELAREDPVPAAIVAYARGVAAVHHLFRAHRLARGAAGEQAAREILGEIHASVGQMSAEEASEALRRLTG